MSCARLRWLAVLAALWLAACAAPQPAPEPVPLTPEEEAEPERVEVPTPLVEYPPIEPVEPPMAAAPADAAPASSPPATTASPAAQPPANVAMVAPPPSPVPPAASAPQVVEDLELVGLLNDLTRYGGMGPDDVRRELTLVTATLGRQRTDANRVRLAVLYTMARNPQDDQRALQLLENVSKSNPGSPAVKQLALVLQVQIVGRQRAVRDEQQKADAALQKLEALRQMERSLLRDRARSGGGGGGGSGGGSGGGGGGGGG
ncbi:MAG: hypothetical protein U1F10_12285 [Burkholderiales bacterium]